MKVKQIARTALETVSQPALSKIHRFHNAHRGEKCYIIGDGITLKWFDLTAFEDRIALPLVYVPFHNDFAALQTPYLSVVEPWCFYGPWYAKAQPRKWIWNGIQEIYKKEIIRKNPDKEYFVNLSNYMALWGRNINFIYQDIHDHRLPADFITHRLRMNQGSFRWAVSLAIYMGFEDIHLVSCDYTHDPSRSLHWYEKGEGKLIPQPGYEREFLTAAQQYADITTITLDGGSEVLNAVTYQNFTGRSPQYRENDELMRKEYLDVFRTFPGYTM